MSGIEAALSGRLGRQPERRTTKAGKPMAILNVAVDEADDSTTWVKVLAVGEERAAACKGLEAGARVHVEG